MNITATEMRGILTGKCLPADIKVNEELPDYLVRKFSDLQSKLNALAAESVLMRQIIDSVTDLDNKPQYHDEGMGCGLEDRNITDRYEAMQYGWDEAMERVYGEVIPCAEELDFSATDAVIRDLKAQGAEAVLHALMISDDDDFSTAPDICTHVAASYRAGKVE